MGVLGHQGGVQMHGGIKTWGVSRCPQTTGGVKSMPPKCKSYRPLKKIRGVWTYGGVRGIRGHPNAWWHPNIPYHIGYHFVSLWVSFGRGVWHINMDAPMLKSNLIIYQKTFRWWIHFADNFSFTATFYDHDLSVFCLFESLCLAPLPDTNTGGSLFSSQASLLVPNSAAYALATWMCVSVSSVMYFFLLYIVTLDLGLWHSTKLAELGILSFTLLVSTLLYQHM